MQRLKVFYGILFCILVAGAAHFLSFHIPIGAVSIAILLGVLLSNLITLPVSFKSGIGFSEKKILAWAISLMGVSLDYSVLMSLGPLTILLILASVLFTIFISLALGHLFHIERDLALLLGVGNAVCGSSAIAAVQGVLHTREENVGVSLAAINLFGTIGIFLLPLVSISIGSFGPRQEGILIGNTLQAIGQVTAAGYSLGEVAGKTATMIKMGRILLITPVVLILNFLLSRNPARSTGKDDADKPRVKPGVPLYIVVFLFLSIVNSMGLIPGALASLTASLSKIVLLIAMAAIGMKISFRELSSGGKSALIVGSITFAGQILFNTFLLRIGL
jgi:uncharacterized integral membrane protein (TIGR00698 family)